MLILRSAILCRSALGALESLILVVFEGGLNCYETFDHPELWADMEENSKIVARMPDWLKGSPVNERILEKPTKETVSVLTPSGFQD